MTAAQIVIGCALAVTLVLYTAWFIKTARDMRAATRRNQNRLADLDRRLRAHRNQAQVRELVIRHFTPEQRAKIWHDAQVIAQFRRELQDDATWQEEVRGGDHGDRGADGERA
jgi:hypothetical protein